MRFSLPTAMLLHGGLLVWTLVGFSEVKLTDFGLAKVTGGDTPETDSASPTAALTAPGITMGTVAYMSPEQARGAPVDTQIGRAHV